MCKNGVPSSCITFSSSSDEFTLIPIENIIFMTYTPVTGVLEVQITEGKTFTMDSISSEKAKELTEICATYHSYKLAK